MAVQTEKELEADLVSRLEKLGYAFVAIKDEKDLLANLKTQLEKHNGVSFSPKEFEKVLNILSKGTVFEKDKTLRRHQHIVRDDDTDLYFRFLNTDAWCQNEYQVTQQVTMEGSYENRYDVTILVNGLPLTQIELKRRGLELKEAFNQINRYQKHSFGASVGLFQYIQIFVISNGVNTKYYSNNAKQSFEQTFFWTDKDNNRLSNIFNGFTDVFLEPCHLSKMICKYIVLNETYKILMVLRPYQYYAVEALVNQVENSTHNAYIWHTTGSGKTLTSFKASQILMQSPKVKKVVFVVDRKDLDYQTAKEFNSFSEGSVDSTDNTKTLVKQFADDTKLIVTTIQKLNTAISKPQYLAQMEKLRDERIIFIFDECHRSQFGETHKNINKFFRNKQLFGFTGTPIFADNAAQNKLGLRTTKDLFGECLHKYVINDAIRDENVLKFSVEYIGKQTEKKESENNLDIATEETETVESKQALESPKRLEKIVDYILAQHDRKTHGKEFTAMFCVSNVPTLIKYYDIFHQKKLAGQHNLKIATVFSYTANENSQAANGMYEDDDSFIPDDNTVLDSSQVHSRDKLEEFIGHYNQLFNVKYSTKDSESFYNYYNDISKKVRQRQIDILLVVNMFLTGFDSPALNTLYVDKNLKYHGLIQAYSRTNRILNAQKSQGNIVVFRNLKEATDEAITLFSNKEAIDVIIMQPYEDYTKKFEEVLQQLKEIVPTPNKVDDLATEEDELAFVQTFREIIRTKNILESFADFSWADLGIEEQQFADYQSKYLDLHDKVKRNNSTGTREQPSILNDVDFELVLLHRDEINVAYILKLLAKLKTNEQGGTTEEVQKEKDKIYAMLNTESTLRSKREFIDKFIQYSLPSLTEDSDIEQAFREFWEVEKTQALDKLVTTENLSIAKTQKLIENYLFTEREPLSEEIVALLEGEKPKLMERKPLVNRILNGIKDFIDTFIKGV